MSKKWKNKPQQAQDGTAAAAPQETTAPPAATKPAEPAREPAPAKSNDWDSLAEDSRFDPELDLGPTEARPKATQTESDPEDQPDPEEEPRQAAPPPRLSARLLAMAEDVGINRAEAEQYDANSLIEIIRIEREQIAAERAAEEKARKKPDPEPEDEVDWGYDAKERRKLTEQDFDPETASRIKRAHEKEKTLNKRLSTLEQRLEHEAKARQSAQAQQVVGAFDRFFAKHPDIFGEGTVDEIDPRSEEAEARATFYDAAKGDPRVIERKFKALYGRTQKAAPKEEPKKAEQEKAGLETNGEAKKKRWNDAALQKPSHREHDEPKGEMKAMKAAARWQREHGMVVDPFEGAEESSLP